MRYIFFLFFSFFSFFSFFLFFPFFPFFSFFPLFSLLIILSIKLAFSGLLHLCDEISQRDYFRWKGCYYQSPTLINFLDVHRLAHPDRITDRQLHICNICNICTQVHMHKFTDTHCTLHSEHTWTQPRARTLTCKLARTHSFMHCIICILCTNKKKEWDPMDLNLTRFLFCQRLTQVKFVFFCL